MAADYTNKFKRVATATLTTLASPGKALGATSINVGSTTNYPTDTSIIISIRSVDAGGNQVAGTYTEWNAIVTSGTSLSIEAAPVYGSDQIYAAASTTQVYMVTSSYAQNALIDGILTSIDQDGTLKAGAVDNAACLANNVVEAAAIKADAVETAKIKDANVTMPKISNPYKFKASKITSDQTIGSSYTPTLITLTNEVYDTNSNYDTGTSKYIVPVTGYYFVSGSCRLKCTSTGEVGISINNANLGFFRTPMATNEYMTCATHGVAYFTAGMEVYLTAYSQNGATIYKDFADQTYLLAHLLSV